MNGPCSHATGILSIHSNVIYLTYFERQITHLISFYPYPFINLQHNRYRLREKQFNPGEQIFYDILSIIISVAHACSPMNSLDENRNIVLKSSSGVITTPGYPSSYPQDLIKQCFWKIQAPVGNIVRVDFLSFRLPSFRTCLIILFAINKINPTQKLFCGLRASFLLYSMTNEIGIEGPQSYGFNLGRGGFIANYTTMPAGKNEGWGVTQYVMCEGRNFV